MDLSENEDAIDIFLFYYSRMKSNLNYLKAEKMVIEDRIKRKRKELTEFLEKLSSCNINIINY